MYVSILLLCLDILDVSLVALLPKKLIQYPAWSVAWSVAANSSGSQCTTVDYLYRRLRSLGHVAHVSQLQ